MSHITHYRVLPWTKGLLTSPESIAEVPDWQAIKTAKFSLSLSLSLSLPLSLSLSLSPFFRVSQPSTITAEAITMIQMQ